MTKLGGTLSAVLMLATVALAAGGPQVSIISPTNGSALEGGTLTVTVQFSADKGNVKVIQLLLDGAVIGTFNNPANKKSGTHAFVVDVSAAPGETLTFVARAFQGSVHSKKFTDSAPVRVLRQSAHLPKIQLSIVSPVNGDILNSSTADVTVTFDAADVLQLLIDDVVVLTFDPPVPSGVHTFTNVDLSGFLGELTEFSVRGIDGDDVVTLGGVEVLVNDPANPAPPDNGLVFNISKSEDLCGNCSGAEIKWSYTMTKPTIGILAPVTGKDVSYGVQARIHAQYVALDGHFDEGRNMITGVTVDMSTSLQVNAKVEFGECVTNHTKSKIWSAGGAGVVRTVAFTGEGNEAGFGSPFAAGAAKASCLEGSDLSYSAEKGVETGEEKALGLELQKIATVAIEITVAKGTTSIKGAINVQQKDFDKETFFLNTQSNAGTVLMGTGGPLVNGHAFSRAVAEGYHKLVLRGKTTLTLSCSGESRESTFFVRTNDDEDSTVEEDKKPWAATIDGQSASIEQGIPLTRKFGKQADADSDGNGDKSAAEDKLNRWFPLAARVPAFE